MLSVLRAGLRMGRVTTSYPSASAPAVGYRGRPMLDAAKCTSCGDCVTTCPPHVISLVDSTWRMDLAGCVFCGLCEDVCPEHAIQLTSDFLLASGARADLNEAYSVPDGPILRRPSADARIQSILGRSLHVRHMDTGSDNSTEWEITTLLGPVYDVQRLGIDFVASPRHADLLLVTGPVTRHLEPALHATYEAMPAPRLVVAAGDEACGGGLLAGSYAVVGPVDRCLPVDVYIPGSPPRPEALIQGLLLAVGRRYGIGGS